MLLTMRYTLFILFWVYAFSFCQAQHLVEVDKGYSETSVNTAVFRNNALATHNNRQYICYYNHEGYLMVGKRELGTSEWTLQRTPYKGNVSDAHNVACLTVDRDGYIHLAFDHHGHPLNYCKSIAPHSLQMGDKISMVGDDEHNVTYPEFYTLSNGNLLFAYRSGSSGRGNLVLNRYDTSTQQWNRMHSVLIDGENERNAYWQIYVDAQGAIHLSWVWRETWMVETNHDLCYARSSDNGETWHKANGEPYTLPITQTNAEYACIIPQESELINQTSMSADENGNPYIATYWRSLDSDVPQYRLVWHDGEAWHNCQVGERTTPFSLKGGGTKRIPIARPRIVADKNAVYYMFRDEEQGSKVSMAYAVFADMNTWKNIHLTHFAVDAWEPMHDADLWKQKQMLHLFVQNSGQGDGETTEVKTPQPIYVLEVDLNTLFK